MIKMTKNLFLIVALVGGAIGFSSCSTTSTNTTANNTTANKNTTVTNTTTTTTTKTETNTTAPSNTNEKAKTETASTGEKIGVEECDNFIEKYDACISSKVPEASREQLKKSIEQWRTSWKQLAANPQTKSTLTSACKQAMESTKQSTAAYGCAW